MQAQRRRHGAGPQDRQRQPRSVRYLPLPPDPREACSDPSANRWRRCVRRHHSRARAPPPQPARELLNPRPHPIRNTHSGSPPSRRRFKPGRKAPHAGAAANPGRSAPMRGGRRGTGRVRRGGGAAAAAPPPRGERAAGVQFIELSDDDVKSATQQPPKGEIAEGCAADDFNAPPCDSTKEVSTKNLGRLRKRTAAGGAATSELHEDELKVADVKLSNDEDWS
ncbi:serine/arginine repetitive matrix protein 1 isoform X2 [Triticum aestivum]|uniref:serine/arginine repetitive matrix protein 1 isoform X2 n=1 Tax=Triticum aestivum TaxID=4565 RepID=UPI001D00576F|nr:serine/arginine repetitive matrix protein 1-like isoform X2 [Triticum aestivum]